MHTVITDTSSLAAFCERLANEAFITIDTEFMREKTYYPELCLVQVAGTNEAAAIDPLAPDIDLTPLYTLLANTSVLKVFHACKQDMEIFYQKMGTLPAPIFDTQVAAMVLGYGESIGYEGLVNKVLGKPVDKSSRFTDWGRRPLTDKQIDYAMGDVLFLREISEVFGQKLDEAGRTEWIDEEMEPLRDPKTYDSDPEEAWKKVRIRNTSPKYLAMLRAATRWRELTARGRNVPRGRIMKDETLAEVAHSKPEDFAALQAIRGFYPTMSSAHYDPLFEALREAQALPSSEHPRLPDKVFFPPESEALAEMLRLLLKACAASARVVPRIIADKDDLEALAMGNRENIHALTGWRNEIFGQRALLMLEGKIALKADKKNGITFIDIA
jgi:ribonuclease D